MENLADTMMSSALAYQEEQQEVPQMPFWAKTLENIPAATAVAGNYGRRGSNTILRGARGTTFTGSSRAVSGGFLRQGIVNNLRPFSRFRSQDHLIGTARPISAKYQPFFASDFANAVDRGMTGRARTSFGQSLSRFMPQQQASSSAPLMAGGAYSRISAAGKVGWMSDARFAKSAANPSGMQSFMRSMGYSDTAANKILQNKTATRAALLTGGGGRATGRVGGFMARSLGKDASLGIAASGGSRTGAKVAARWMGELGLRNAGSVTNKAIMQAAMKKGGAKAIGKGATLAGARLAGMAIPGVNVAMTAWMAYDLAKLGTQLAGKAVETAGQSYTSFRGDIDTRVMGQTFKDSEAALTSRARGVQAIQNSRMNARSALGAEAGGMAAHFG